MRPRPQLGTIRLNPREDEAYRGYIIRRGLNGQHHVSKAGHHICTRDTLAQARADVDLLTIR